jgi:hypothetical protein
MAVNPDPVRNQKIRRRLEQNRGTVLSILQPCQHDVAAGHFRLRYQLQLRADDRCFIISGGWFPSTFALLLPRRTANVSVSPTPHF